MQVADEISSNSKKISFARIDRVKEMDTLEPIIIRYAYTEKV